MNNKKIEILSEKEIVYANLNPEENKVIVETAGFVPLEVKFKRFEQNGIVAQFNSSEFTSQDYRNMYLNPDYEISPEDDIEEAFEKLRLQQEYMNQISNSKLKTPEISEGNSGVAPQADSTKSKKKEEENVDSDSQ